LTTRIDKLFDIHAELEKQLASKVENLSSGLAGGEQRFTDLSQTLAAAQSAFQSAEATLASQMQSQLSAMEENVQEITNKVREDIRQGEGARLDTLERVCKKVIC